MIVVVKASGCQTPIAGHGQPGLRRGAVAGRVVADLDDAPAVSIVVKGHFSGRQDILALGAGHVLASTWR
jgi:hypothetical protein